MRPRLLHGDNLDVMRALAAEGFKAHLIYADPPFATGRDFYHEPRDGGPAELAYSDKWPTFEAYIEALRERVAAARDLLTADGCMFVHVDPTASHYVKVMMDGVFGRACFASEIVWRYRKWSHAHDNFHRNHDLLFRYVREADAVPRWNQLYEPLAASTIETWGTGKRIGRERKSTSDEPSPGAPMGDVWEDIGILAASGHERTGYPTQKPERLLERIILSCSHPGDTVLDPYAGSGVTLRAAARLRRVAVGIDQSPVAIRVATEALARPAQIELL